MITLLDRLLSLLWSDLLVLACRFIDHRASQLDNIGSESLNTLYSEFLLKDIEKCLPDVYKLLFQADNQEMLNAEITRLLDHLRDHVRDTSDPVFSDIELMQQVVSIAAWKYNLDILPELDEFAREFDRVDDERERHRIISEF